MLDTARYKYPPHWVNIDKLYKSVCTNDCDTGELRGFIMLTRKLPQKSLETQPASAARLPKLPTLSLALEVAFSAFLSDGKNSETLYPGL